MAEEQPKTQVTISPFAAMRTSDILVNPKAETGNWTGWTVVGAYHQVDNHQYCTVHAGAWQFYLYWSGYIEQALIAPLHRSKAVTFSVCLLNMGTVTLYFDDATSKSITVNYPIFTILNLLTANAQEGGLLFPEGKTLTKIRFAPTAQTSLTVDDVRLNEDILDDDISPDVVTSIVTLRENGISSCSLVANDEKGKQYLATMSLGRRVVAKYKYEDGDDIWKTVFDGKIEELSPELSEAGEVLGVTAYGKGYPLKKMRIAWEYGYQSWNPLVTTFRKILTDGNVGIMPAFVEHIFRDGAKPSGHSINTNYVYGYLDPVQLPYILFPFENAFDCLTDLINLESSARFKHEEESPDWRGLHWIVLPSGELCVAPVGSHNVYGKDANFLVESVWSTYARATPMEVTKEMILQSFTEHEIEGNYVMVAGKFMRPLNEGWSEDAAILWEVKTVGIDSYVQNDADIKVKGANSLKLHNSYNGVNYFRLKEDLGIDFGKLTTVNRSPIVNFWARRGGVWLEDPPRVCLFKDWNNFFYRELLFEADDLWTKFELATPKAGETPESVGWAKYGTLGWADIHYIGFSFARGAGLYTDCWVDDINIVGNAIRAAYDQTSIDSPKGCRMIAIKDSLASTDSLSQAEDNSPLARVALSELLKAREPVITGKIVVPLAPTFKAGQLIHIHAARKGTTPETFNIDRDFRITELQHAFVETGAVTTLTLNSDLKNSVPRGQTDSYSTIIRAVNPDSQTKTFASIRTGGEFDIGLTVIARDYPS